MHPDDILLIAGIISFIIFIVIVKKLLSFAKDKVEDDVIPFIKDQTKTLLEKDNDDRMLKSKQLYDNGIITKDEYETRISNLKKEAK